MNDEITTGLKWFAGLMTILTLPFAWIHQRQNRLEDAVIRTSESVVEISNSVTENKVNLEHIKADIAELKQINSQRRKTDTES